MAGEQRYGEWIAVRRHGAGGHVAELVLDRPEAMNAVSTAFARALTEALRALGGDRTVRAVVVTSSHERAFCVGADLKERNRFSDADLGRQRPVARAAYTAVLDLPAPAVAAQAANRVFELRTYTAAEGKIDALNARFRDHTLGLFKKHGITNVGYWMPTDGPTAKNTLVYLISHASRDAAKQSWAAFQKDPEWQKVAQESQVNGKIVASVVSQFLVPTDYSPMK